VGVVGINKTSSPRTQSILLSLERLGYDVRHVALPRSAGTPRRLLLLLREVPALREVDWLYVPPSNQVLAPVIWLLARLLGKPVLLDYLTGLTDVFEDRGQPPLLKRWLSRQIDRFNIARCDTITDTAAHRDAFERLLGSAPRRMRVLPVGAREGLPTLPLPETPPLIVQWVGTYIPFQGVDIILRAAERLRAREDIVIELIGDGQTYAASEALAKTLELANVRFVRGSFTLDDLEPMIARSAIWLGVFGAAAKTDYVIPNKVLDSLAWRRPLITAESRALREFLTPGEHCIAVPPGDPAALAEAIVMLADQPGQRALLAERGHRHVVESLSGREQDARLRHIIEELLCLKPS
jgi:glycosyltransferase involved in cell wall biosynthesis